MRSLDRFVARSELEHILLASTSRCLTLKPKTHASLPRGDHFPQADLDEAARAADATREAIGAVVASRLG